MQAELTTTDGDVLDRRELTPDQLLALNQRAGDVAELQWKPVKMSMYELGQLTALLLCVPGAFGENDGT